MVFFYFYFTPLIRAYRRSKAEKRRQSLLRPLGLDRDNLRTFGCLSSHVEEKDFALASGERARSIACNSLQSKVHIRQTSPIQVNPFVPSSHRSQFLVKSVFDTCDKPIEDDDSSLYSFASDHESPSKGAASWTGSEEASFVISSTQGFTNPPAPVLNKSTVVPDRFSSIDHMKSPERSSPHDRRFNSFYSGYDTSYHACPPHTYAHAGYPTSYMTSSSHVPTPSSYTQAYPSSFISHDVAQPPQSLTCAARTQWAAPVGYIGSYSVDQQNTDRSFDFSKFY